MNVFAFLLWVAATGLLFLSCGGGGDGGSNDYADSALYIPRTELARTNELKTTTGKTWIVHQTPMLDSSLVSVVVDVVGISDDKLSIDFGETDPVTELHMEDLDKDGYQELYFITVGPDPEASGTIYGLYSERDESVMMISYEGPTPYTMKEGEAYVGYRGHDRFRFEKGALTNTIPVFKPDDNDGSPTGGSRTVTYELVKGPSVMRLRPNRQK